MRIFDDNRLVVTYTIPAGKGHLVQDPRFYAALKKDREMNRRKYGQGRRIKGRAKRTISPSRPPYEMDVGVRPIGVYDQVAGEVQNGRPDCQTERKITILRKPRREAIFSISTPFGGTRGTPTMRHWPYCSSVPCYS